MVALDGNDITSVDLSVPAGKIKSVPADHYMIHTAVSVGTCMGQELSL
jgi:6-phosphofructokinase 1